MIGVVGASLVAADFAGVAEVPVHAGEPQGAFRRQYLPTRILAADAAAFRRAWNGCAADAAGGLWSSVCHCAIPASRMYHLPSQSRPTGQQWPTCAP